jgi:hypothetical protein
MTRRVRLHGSRSDALNDHGTDSGQQSMMPVHEILQDFTSPDFIFTRLHFHADLIDERSTPSEPVHHR